MGILKYSRILAYKYTFQKYKFKCVEVPGFLIQGYFKTFFHSGIQAMTANYQNKPKHVARIVLCTEAAEVGGPRPTQC